VAAVAAGETRATLKELAVLVVAVTAKHLQALAAATVQQILAAVAAVSQPTTKQQAQAAAA